MQNILRQFGAKATASFSERFHRSIIRLTVLYSLTLALILAISCFISYTAFSQRIVHRFQDVSPIIIEIDTPVMPAPANMPTPGQLREDLVESLLLVNISLLGLAIILSYWLAKKTLEPIRRAYEEQERFLGDVSHELRTPIAILQMDLENELLKTTHGERRQAIESKLEEVHRMGKLVNDVLSLSRMGHAENAPHVKEVVLKESIDKIIARLQVLAERLRVDVHVIAETDRIVFPVDEDLFSAALTNIIKNAIVYNRSNGTVSITLRQTSTAVCIEVRDTGIGIAPADQEHIFNRFYRVDKSRTRQTGGTGLGLAIAQSSIERMNGTIAMKSTLGTGTTVTVCFPR